MSTRSLSIFLVAVVLAVSIPAAASHPPAQLNLPVTFEANEGQTDPSVRFLSRTRRSTLFLTRSEAVLRLRGADEKSAVVRWRMAGANQNPRVTGESLLRTKSNYFRGNEARTWRTDIANYGQVRYHGVYPGIDVVYHGNERQLEYDFVVAPKANPGRISVIFEGADSMTLGKDGELILRTAAGDLVQPRPWIYQDKDGRRQTIEGRYALRGRNEVGFVLGRYDRNLPLIIDPVLVWSTYVGHSSEDLAYAIAADSSGNTYITGATGSASFPTVNPIQGTKAYDWDVFVTKINAAGTAIVYSTFLGGNGWNEYGLGIAVDSSGNAHVTGATNATDFPGVTAGSIQPSFGGTGSNRDAFATKINAAGNAILFSTYLGGNGDDIADGITTDSSGNTYVAGATKSTAIPWITAGAIQSTYGGGNYDGFVIKIDTSGAKVWATYLGNNGWDGASAIRIDGSGNAWVSGGTDGTNTWPGVTGSSLQSTYGGNGDGFLTQINAAGTAISYSTWLGGSGNDGIKDLELDGSGNIIVSGDTESTSFPGVTGSSIQPSHAGSTDMFVAKLNSSATSITWSTFFGGSDVDIATGMDVDGSGNVYVAGSTLSTNFPVASAIQPTYGGGIDAVALRINAAGTSAGWATYLGGSSEDQSFGLGVDGSGNAYITGFTDSTGFPGTSGSAIQSTYGGGYDGWVTKIANTASPSLTSINPASGVTGTQVTLTGTGFGAAQGTGSVWLGNKLAGSIVSWSDTQIVATVATNAVSGSASVQQAGTWSNSITFTITSPGISGISPSTARAGDQVTITGTNFGTTQGTGSVWLGSKLAGSIVSWSDTQIVATVASGSVTGTAQVQQGGVWDNYGTFTVITPVLSSISPTSGPVGTQVTFTGTGFGTAQGSGKVWLANKYATIVSWSDTQIVATVIAGSSTSASQVLQGGVWSNTITFTVTP